MTKAIEKVNETAGERAFALAQRRAKLYCSGDLVPAVFQGNIANTLIAMNYADRLGTDPMAIMQSMHIIHGKPGFSSTFLIAMANSSGKFTPIRFRFEGEPGKDTYGCRAYACDKESGEECVGPLVTIAMAKAEGWYSRKDKYGKECSKWQTMSELMLHYRAATIWTRVFSPELSLGMRTIDEIEDIREVEATVVRQEDNTLDALADKLEKVEREPGCDDE